MDIAGVIYQILSPRDGKPVMEVIQDTVVGGFRMTKDWTIVPDRVFANLQMVNNFFTGKLPKLPMDRTYYTGKELMSQIFPPLFSTEVKNRSDEKVIIKPALVKHIAEDGKETWELQRSQIVTGTLDKDVIMNLSKGIVTSLYHDYGPLETRRFYDNLQRLVCRWLLTAGFSVGISDLVIDKDTAENLKTTIHDMKLKAYKKIEDVRIGKLENNSIFSNEDFFEREIINILNEANNSVGGTALKQIDERTNRMINMVKSGAKGKKENVAQMIACVGQQNVDGKRVAYGFTDRTLPHYTKFDDGPDARGFVSNSFITGLTPQEVYFHAMGGREGLIDTAVKSVSADTKILIIEDQKPKVVEIGAWIDGHMERGRERIQHQKEKQTEVLELQNQVLIPNMDTKGNMMWSPMKYVTRHDPDNELYEVTTQSGRKVIVTQYDSMLVWNPEKEEFLKKPTTEIKIGEFVPVTSKFPDPPIPIDIQEYLPQDLPSVADYPQQNDVAMDPIVSIVSVDVSLHPKVYDVTVPNTYHFSLWNGLNLYDTSDTGYIQRRLVKAMEDCKVYYDQTVRNATGTIVQFLYGEDGMEGNKMEKQFIPTMDMDFLTLDTEYYLRPEDIQPIFMTAAAFQETNADSAWQERARKHYEDILKDREFLIIKVFRGNKESMLVYPIAFERILKDVTQRAQLAGVYPLPTDLTPTYVLDTIDSLIQSLKIHDVEQGTRFLHILLRIHLSPKKLIIKQKLSRAMFDMVVEKIKVAYYKAVVHAGEMVGIVAAQTIGENSTQLVLDSFHSSGTAAAVKATSGVPRFKELLSVSKNIKTPILTIYLKEDIGTVYDPTEDTEGNVSDPRVQEAKEKAMKVMHSLEITRLVDILDKTEIYWDPSGIQDDQGFLEVYHAFQQINKQECTRNSPWVLRIQLNREKMYRLQLTMLDIYIRIKSAYPTVDCAFTDDNAKELIFRIQLSKNDRETDDIVPSMRALEHNLIHNLLLKGLKGIKKVSMHMKNINTYIREDGTEAHIYDKKTFQPQYEAEKMRFAKKAEWVLDTDGTNLKEILANPNIDAYRTRSNDIWEIYHTLGVEAARNALYHEIIDVSDTLNYRHLSLLLDTMSNRGTLMSVDRHGINRGDVGPLAKSSFEETTDILIKASAFSEYDHINGVSANIMLGQLPPCGTGDCEILFDEDKFADLMRTSAKSATKTKTPSYEDVVAQDEAGPSRVPDEFLSSCADGDIAFSYKIPSKIKSIGRTMPSMKVQFT